MAKVVREVSFWPAAETSNAAKRHQLANDGEDYDCNTYETKREKENENRKKKNDEEQKKGKPDRQEDGEMQEKNEGGGK